MHATNGTKFQSAVSICASLVILLLVLFSLNINQLLCVKVENVIRIKSKLRWVVAQDVLLSQYLSTQYIN